jgi:phosphatidylglycerophosphatase A
LKPWPASWADSEVEGGAGVMLDDLFAGAYSVLPLVALRIMGFI